MDTRNEVLDKIEAYIDNAINFDSETYDRDVLDQIYDLFQPVEPQEEPPKYPTSWRDFTMTDKIEAKHTADNGKLIEKLKHDLIVYMKGYKIESWFTMEEINLIISSLGNQNQQPEGSVTDEEIKDQPKKIFKTSNDYYGINPK